MKYQIAIVLVCIIFVFTTETKKSTSIYGNIFEGSQQFADLSVEEGVKEAKEIVRKHMRRFMDSAVTFTDCPGPHDDTYDIDDDYSHTEPDIAKKNIDITLILEGVMNQDEHVDQLHLDVYWNGNLFHTEDHKLDDDVEEQEPYELKFTWFVPGFAPSGAYIVDLIVKSAGQELGCERASFTL